MNQEVTAHAQVNGSIPSRKCAGSNRSMIPTSSPSPFYPEINKNMVYIFLNYYYRKPKPGGSVVWSLVPYTKKDCGFNPRLGCVHWRQPIDISLIYMFLSEIKKCIQKNKIKYFTYSAQFQPVSKVLLTILYSPMSKLYIQLLVDITDLRSLCVQIQIFFISILPINLISFKIYLKVSKPCAFILFD